MVMMLLVGVLIVLVVLPLVSSMRNPVVNVVDDVTTTTRYSEVDAAMAQLLGSTRGYEIRMMAPGTYTLSYRRTPAWAIVLGVLTFPIGILVMLFCRETLRLTLSATAVDSGTRLLVFGRAHKKLAHEVGAAVQSRFQRMRATVHRD